MSTYPEATPEMVAAVMFGSRFRCCVCGKIHKRLDGDPAMECFYAFRRMIKLPIVEYEPSPLARVLEFDPPKFDIGDYPYVLAAPSVEAAKTFLRERNEEWLAHCKRLEEQVLDPERELPPIKLAWPRTELYFEGHKYSLRLREEGVLEVILKDARVASVAYACITSPGFRLLDVQWKKIGDPGILLLEAPRATSNVLLSGRHHVKFLPKEIRTVSEALAYLEERKER